MNDLMSTFIEQIEIHCQVLVMRGMRSDDDDDDDDDDDNIVMIVDMRMRRFLSG